VTVAPLLVIQHEDECPPAWFGEWLTAAGLPYVVLPAHRLHHEAPPTRQLHRELRETRGASRRVDPGYPAIPGELGGDYSGLLVLGGEMGAYDDDAHPWLTATKGLIASTVQQGKPFLGICLGHQLAAVALGGEVVPNPHGHAKGLTPIGHTAAGSDDVLMQVVEPGAPSVMWNYDIVSRLPDGAVALAYSPDGTVQAARFATLAWGVQFHPEASPDVFDGWTVSKPSAVAPHGIDVPAAARHIRAAEPELRRHWETLARRFAAVVLDHAARTSAPSAAAVSATAT
jgi:GMP synthase (glutamine-hydrolysing)